MNAAVRGTLSDPGVLEQQVQRMLRDPRANALVDNFASRWLELGKLAGVVPDTELYPEFDENLREAMEQETKLFVASQLHDDRSVIELLTANYSFLNERLATHYGIREHLRQPFPAGDASPMARAAGCSARRSLLTVTSYPNRTSVTMRGRVGAGQPARRAAAAAAARRSRAQGRRRRRAAAIAARAHGGAPQESGVRVVPSADGSAGLLAREFRRDSASGAR